MTDAPSLRKGIAFWIVKNAPFALMSKFLSYISSVVSAKDAKFATPAFTNKMSIFPSFLDTSEYSLSTSASLATSACTASVSLPKNFTASSSVFWLRPAIAIFAPSSCNRFAEANPIPLFPPVTTATFPCNLFILSSRGLSDLIDSAPSANRRRDIRRIGHGAWQVPVHCPTA